MLLSFQPSWCRILFINSMNGAPSRILIAHHCVRQLAFFEAGLPGVILSHVLDFHPWNYTNITFLSFPNPTYVYIYIYICFGSIDLNVCWILHAWSQFHHGSRTSLEKHDPDLDQTQGWGWDESGECVVFPGLDIMFLKKSTTMKYGDPTYGWLVHYLYNIIWPYIHICEILGHPCPIFHVPTWHGNHEKRNCDQLSKKPFLKVCLKKTTSVPLATLQPVDWIDSALHQGLFRKKQTKFGYWYLPFWKSSVCLGKSELPAQQNCTPFRLVHVFFVLTHV